MNGFEKLGKQFKVRRLEAGLTQWQLAADSGLSEPTIAAIEKGNPQVSIKTLEKVSLVLDCNLEYKIKDNERAGL